MAKFLQKKQDKIKKSKNPLFLTITMRIVTPRLVIREFQEKDIANLVANINNLNVSRYLSLVPYPYHKKDAKFWVHHNQGEARKRPRKNYDLGIELKSTHELIGGIGLCKIDRFVGKATMGYWLGEDYWRQGIMSEAARAMIDFAFNKLGLTRIDIEAFTKNIPSNGLIKSLRFKYEGTSQRCHRA